MTKDEALKKAFKQAFQLGQDYWYQADHEYVSQNKKSDVTRAKFEQLMEDAIKEALAQPEQEPVAWVCYGTHGHHDIDFLEEDVDSLSVGTKLYTTPPQRTWAGLTEAQCGVLWKTNMTPFEYYQAIEAKLKEKNT